MFKVFKFPFKVSDEVTVEVPGLLHCLKIASQSAVTGELCLWALVDPEVAQARQEIVHLRIAGTGHPLHTLGVMYVDTVLDGPLVWHVFAPLSDKKFWKRMGC